MHKLLKNDTFILLIGSVQAGLHNITEDYEECVYLGGQG
jgi:hypothetical protein